MQPFRIPKGKRLAGCRIGDAPGIQFDEPDSRASEDHGPLNHVGQFPDVSGPPIGLELFHLRLGDAGIALVVLGAELLEKMHGQKRNILPAFAQGRHGDGKDIEPVIQVVPEAPLRHFLLQVLVGGRNQQPLVKKRIIIDRSIRFSYGEFLNEDV